jgi:hypothetical protein
VLVVGPDGAAGAGVGEPGEGGDDVGAGAACGAAGGGEVFVEQHHGGVDVEERCVGGRRAEGDAPEKALDSSFCALVRDVVRAD